MKVVASLILTNTAPGHWGWVGGCKDVACVSFDRAIGSRALLENSFSKFQLEANIQTGDAVKQAEEEVQAVVAVDSSRGVMGGERYTPTYRKPGKLRRTLGCRANTSKNEPWARDSQCCGSNDRRGRWQRTGDLQKQVPDNHRKPLTIGHSGIFKTAVYEQESRDRL